MTVSSGLLLGEVFRLGTNTSFSRWSRHSAMGVEAVLEGGPDVLLVVGTAELDQLLRTGAVLLDVGVGGMEGLYSN